mgnify:FL=1|jgi:hypothetical protein
MRTKFAIEDEVIQTAVGQNYGIPVRDLVFLPKGDISYAYRIICTDGTKYFLKLFDKSTRKGREGIRHLKFYLPVTRDMYDLGFCRNITYPIKNNRGDFAVDIGSAIIVLFNYIEGESLADAYPFPRELLEKTAKSIARIHDLTGRMRFKTVRIENFDLFFLDGLERDLVLLERIREKNHAYVINDIIQDIGSLSKDMEEDMGNHTDGNDTRTGGNGTAGAAQEGTTDGEKPEKFVDPEIRALCEYVLPKKDRILDFMEQLYQYRDRIECDPYEMVLTHGDIWGGNLMLDPRGELYFTDWESARIAPREADLRHYLFEDFDFFLEKYKEESKGPVYLDPNLLGFYVYRSHLSNLANWISRMLHDNQSREQNQSDFGCITLHCMERWDQVDQKMQSSPLLRGF